LEAEEFGISDIGAVKEGKPSEVSLCWIIRVLEERDKVAQGRGQLGGVSHK